MTKSNGSRNKDQDTKREPKRRLIATPWLRVVISVVLLGVVLTYAGQIIGFV